MNRSDRLILRLLRIIVRLIGGRRMVAAYDEKLQRAQGMSREEMDAELRAEMRRYLGRRA